MIAGLALRFALEEHNPAFLALQQAADIPEMPKNNEDSNEERELRMLSVDEPSHVKWRCDGSHESRKRGYSERHCDHEPGEARQPSHSGRQSE